MQFFPDISWTQFLQCCTGSPRDQFEEMTRRIFIKEFLGGKDIPNSETSHPGVEVEPVFESAPADGSPRKRISFQSKFFDKNVDYDQIKHSAVVAANHYQGKLDRIYLFCNLTINPSRSTKYKKAVDILHNSGIELVQYSDGAVLDFVFRHEDIARYYFLPRHRSVIINEKIYTALNPNGLDEELEEAIPLPDESSDLYQNLLKDKIARCRQHFIDFRFSQLRSELNNVDCTCNKELLFFGSLLDINDGKIEEATRIKDKIEGEYRFDAEWLVSIRRCPRKVTYLEIMPHSIESQAIVLNELLKLQYLDCVLDIYNESKNKDLEPEFKRVIVFSAAVALFNLNRFQEARDVFSQLDQMYHMPAYRFFYLCADLQLRNIEYGYGSKEKADEIANSLATLKAYIPEVPDFSKSNEKLLGVLELHAYYNLMSLDILYLEKAVSAYDSYNTETKNDSGVIYFLGMCYAAANETEKAIAVFSNSVCENDEIVTYQLVTCLLRLNRAQEAKEILDKKDGFETPGILAVRLLTEYRLENPDYEEDLKRAIERYGSSFDTLLPIAYNVDNTELFGKYIKGPLAEEIEKELSDIDANRKVALLLLLIRHKQLPLILSVLKSMNDLKDVDDTAVYQLYKLLVENSNIEISAGGYSLAASTKLSDTEMIADLFIEAEVYLEYFLQVKLACLSAQGRYFAMLQYSKQLYAITGNLGIARNIVAILYTQNERKAENYEPYLSALRHSSVPEHAIAVCSADIRLGRYNDAEEYAYKALYLLNGEDDYDIYRKYFGFISSSMLADPEWEEKNHVSDNMVVELQDNFNNDHSFYVCLDAEADYVENENRSFGIIHLCRGEADYTKLVRASRGQVVKVFNNLYKIVSFVPRSVFAFQFISRHIQEHPEKFDGIALIGMSEDPEEMVEELKKYADHTEQTQRLLECYHFETLESGIPIEMLVNGDYTRYIDCVRMLLYGKNQALYAGEAEIEVENKCAYVPTLSTLVILSQIGHLELLTFLMETVEVVIPQSYIDFFEELFERSKYMLQSSPGTLMTDSDGKLLMVEHDSHIPEMWEEILRWCKKSKADVVSIEERASFKIVPEITGDWLITSMRMNKIQLDALILAKRRKAVYLSDDLFMRKVATWAGIKSNNFTFLLYYLVNKDLASEITIALSKTNYIYTPFITAHSDKIDGVIENLLSGSRKKALYSAMLSNIQKAFLYSLGIEMTQQGENTQ